LNFFCNTLDQLPLGAGGLPFIPVGLAPSSRVKIQTFLFYTKLFFHPIQQGWFHRFSGGSFGSFAELR
jgi:hypothetical protein